MELIKKIKQSETQAQQILEDAKAAAAAKADQAREKRAEDREQAEDQRKKAVEAAVATAASQAHTEVDALKANARAQRQQLKNETQPKIAAAVDKVVNHLRG